MKKHALLTLFGILALTGCATPEKFPDVKTDEWNVTLAEYDTLTVNDLCLRPSYKITKHSNGDLYTRHESKVTANREDNILNIKIETENEEYYSAGTVEYALTEYHLKTPFICYEGNESKGFAVSDVYTVSEYITEASSASYTKVIDYYRFDLTGSSLLSTTYNKKFTIPAQKGTSYSKKKFSYDRLNSADTPILVLENTDYLYFETWQEKVVKQCSLKDGALSNGAKVCYLHTETITTEDIAEQTIKYEAHDICFSGATLIYHVADKNNAK